MFEKQSNKMKYSDLRKGAAVTNMVTNRVTLCFKIVTLCGRKSDRDGLQQNFRCVTNSDFRFVTDLITCISTNW